MTIPMDNISECAAVLDHHKRTWIQYRIGQQVKPFVKQFLIGFAYSVILCTGVFGNLATCIVIARKRYMHTRTNCYLFCLAVSDLLLLVSALPFELYETVYQSYPWNLGTPLCRIRVYFTELSPIVSISVLTLFSVERYLCICHPFRKKFTLFHSVRRGSITQGARFSTPNASTAMDLRQADLYCSLPQKRHYHSHRVSMRNSSLKSCFLLIAIVWACAALLATPISCLSEAFIGAFLPDWEIYLNATQEPSCFHKNLTSLLCIKEYPSECNTTGWGWNTGEPLPESTVCAPNEDSPLAKYVSIPLVLQLSTCLFFVVPMIIMSVLYSRIAVRLRKSNVAALVAQRSSCSGRPGACTPQQRYVINSRKGVTRMLVAVVAAFFICWAPFHLQRILTSAGVGMTVVLADLLFYLSGFLYFISSTVNPILYSLMSVRFRRAFIDTFWKRKSHVNTVVVAGRALCMSTTYPLRNRTTIEVSTPQTEDEMADHSNSLTTISHAV